jgi:hypothetical protein
VVDSYEVVDLADWTRGEGEPGGDEAKRWFIAPESSRHAGHWLFKPRRIKTLKLSEDRDWAWTPGAALLAESDDEFDSKSCRGHTITAIRQALEGLGGPVGTTSARPRWFGLRTRR